jgi:hypothetical protein
LLTQDSGSGLAISHFKKIGTKSLFFTPAAKGAIFWPGCRPTGALFRNYGLCPWGSTIGKFLGEKTPFYGESRNHAGVKDKNPAPIVDTDLPYGPISNLRTDQN